MSRTGSLKVFAFLPWILLTDSVAFGQSNPSLGERGALVRVVTRWNSSCSGSTRSAWDNMVDGWYDDLTNSSSLPSGHGPRAWVRDGFYKNGNIVDSDFTDDDAVTWGNDDGPDRVDEPDACMVALHGGEWNNLRWFGRVRVNEAGSGNCNAYQAHIILGDYDLEFLHMSSCHSMDQDVWWPEWSGTFDGLHQINAFHGIMWIGSTYRSRYKHFADDAFDIPIAEAWLDNLYISWVWGHQQCPVSRGAGIGSTDLWNRMDHEEYDFVYSDPDTPTAHGVIYLKGCDPKDDPPLPN